MNSQDCIWVLSVDIGKINFAFLIEEFNVKKLQEIGNMMRIDRYNKDGSSTPKFRKILDQVCSNGKVILYKNLNLTDGCDPKLKLDPKTFVNMYDVLNKYKEEYFDKCSVFVIEQQMQGFKGKINRMAMKLGQHCYSYFVFHYRDTKEIVEFPAYHKTAVLGAPKIESKTKTGKVSYKAMTKTQRKKWAVDEAVNIFCMRDDMESFETISSKTKKDDLADILTQLQSWKYLKYVDKSI